MASLRELLLVLAVLHGSCGGVVYEDSLCRSIPNCYHNQSALCRNHYPISCSHQLRDAQHEDGNCIVERIDPQECYVETSSYISGPNELPFDLHMYYYNTWMESRAVPNLTFPALTWQSAKFRYEGRENRDQILCRRFSRTNVSHPVSGTLMWDCPFFESPEFSSHSFDLSVITSEGRGGKYAFRVPEKKRFDPSNTMLRDWHVFFFLHLDHIQQSAYLPVTIQLAPFKENLVYNVTLLKCSLQSDQICDEPSTLYSTMIENPKKNATTVGITKQLTHLIPSWSNPAMYAVSVQIVSPACTEEGCFISLSPVYEIKESQLGVWLCIALFLVLIFAMAFTLTLLHRAKENNKLLRALEHKPRTLLLLYLPENQKCLELVKTFADFLKKYCYVHPHVIDIDVGSQNPNNWTCEHMNAASRMLFIVPGNLNGDSITPIRDQWSYALSYLSGHHFIKHHVNKKVAIVLLPFSADVPDQICNVQRFNLIKEMTSLVTWIHDGSWWDEKLVWGPQIRSSQWNVNSPSITKLAQLVDEASQVTKCHKGVVKVLPKETDLINTGGFPSNTESMYSDSQSKASGNEEPNNTVLAIDDGNDFALDIPDVGEMLLRETQESDLSSEENSDLDDSYFL